MSQPELHKAHDLIEQGKFEQARQLLQTLDDPTARLWLAQLNASRRPRKQQLDIPLPLLVSIAIVIGIGALIVIILLTPTLLRQIGNRAASTATPNLADQELWNNLDQYCMVMFSGGQEEPCLSWADTVSSEYHDAAAACIAQFSTEVATPNPNSDLSACFDKANIRLPTDPD